MVLILVSHKDIGVKDKGNASDSDGSKSSSEMDSDGKSLHFDAGLVLV